MHSHNVCRNKLFEKKCRLDCIFVIRENEVLKHQLRKYVSAVQMLKRDDADHSYEAQLYENKLVQVNAKCLTAIYVRSNK